MTNMEILIVILKAWTMISCPIATAMLCFKPVNRCGVFCKIALLPAFLSGWVVEIFVDYIFKEINKE